MLLKILNSLFKLLSWLVTLSIVLACGVAFLLPNVFNIKPYIVQSGSMEPVIHTGSVVWVDENDKDVHVDDIVAYRLSEEMQVIHRVIAEQDGMYITMGDANETEDLRPVSQSEIIGKYFFSVPYLGYILVDLSKNVYKTVVIVAVLLFILLANSFLEDLTHPGSTEKAT